MLLCISVRTQLGRLLAALAAPKVGRGFVPVSALLLRGLSVALAAYTLHSKRFLPWVF